MKNLLTSLTLVAALLVMAPAQAWPDTGPPPDPAVQTAVVDDALLSDLLTLEYRPSHVFLHDAPSAVPAPTVHVDPGLATSTMSYGKHFYNDLNFTGTGQAEDFDFFKSMASVSSVVAGVHWRWPEVHQYKYSNTFALDVGPFASLAMRADPHYEACSAYPMRHHPWVMPVPRE